MPTEKLLINNWQDLPIISPLSNGASLAELAQSNGIKKEEEREERSSIYSKMAD